jgi:hypothetical protein
MRHKVLTTARLGDVIAAVYDEASRYAVSPTEMSRLAAMAVNHLVVQSRRMTAMPAMAKHVLALNT